MIRRRSRARRIAKWTGLVLSVLIFLAWVVSIGRDIGYIAGDRYCIALTAGAACVAVTSVVEEYWQPWRWRPGWVYWLPFGSWVAEHSGMPGGKLISVLDCVVCPLWIPLLIIAVPTVIAWRRDRKPPPGHCKICGYNLTGNVSGRCPECGEAA